MNKTEIEAKIKLLETELESLKLQLKEDAQSTNDFNISKEEQTKIFMSYFKGRDDVFPYLSIDKNDPDTKYYNPACINEWNRMLCSKTMGKKCKTCQHREHIPLTLEVFHNHIFGNKPIGIYPMLDDETCYFLALDFDDKEDEKNIKEDLLAFWYTV